MESEKTESTVLCKPLREPEVVGSSPASATIKTTVFTMKTVVFLTFRAIFKSSKNQSVFISVFIAKMRFLKN